MALPPSKTPPRFIPTLTEVVQVPDSVPLQPAAGAPLRTTVMSPSALSSARPLATAPQPAARPLSPPLPSARPPAVVAPRPAAAPMPVHAASPAVAQRAPAAAVVAAPAPLMAPFAAVAAKPVLTRPLPEGMEEYMVHRVMQRVDVVLDQRLREAIATVVQEQTRSVLPRLREEIESVVRHAVYEAVADELASGAPSVPKG